MKNCQLKAAGDVAVSHLHVNDFVILVSSRDP